MTTGTIFGAAGAIIGAIAFPGVGWAASAGFLIGSLIGNLIDPPKVEGPRLNDLKLQRSEYGWTIPRFWGTGRVAGNVIDQTDLQEHKHKSGGKGGPTVTNYTYSASFDILLGVGPILGCSRIWADARLIWDATTGEDMPCTLYLGTDNQDVDPTFEAIHGVGLQPAYNGYVHAVFTDQDLTDFSNRIPNYEFELYTKVGPFPYRVSTFEPQPDGAGARTTTYANGVITVGVYHTASLANGHYYERQFHLDGTEVAGTAYDAEVNLAGFPSRPIDGLNAATDGLAWWQRDVMITPIAAAPLGGVTLQLETDGQNIVYYHDYIFTLGIAALGPNSGDVGVARWPAPGGQITSQTDTADAVVIVGMSPQTLSNWVLGCTNVDDAVYVYDGATKTLYEYAFDLSALNRQWDLSGIQAVSPVINGHAFTVYRNSTGNLILGCDRGISGSKNMAAFYLNDDLSVTSIGNVPHDTSAFVGAVSELGNSGYVLVADGVESLNPVSQAELLSKIVADISEETTLAASSPSIYDVSELTDEVHWYALASQMTARNAISQLRPLFFFDAVESDDRIVFKKRGATALDTIPDADLCGRNDGDEPDDPLRTTRKEEIELPRTVTLTYYDINADYRTDAQSSPRQVTASQSDVTLSLAVGMTQTEGLQKAWAIQCAEWIERETFEWSTTTRWCQYEPCDVLIVRGREIRVLTANETPEGVINWTGVLNAPSIYTQSSAAVGGGGFVAQDAPGSRVATELVLLDIPILSQHDAPFGFYAAMGPVSNNGGWPGSALYKSLDGGTTWTLVASSGDRSVIGRTADSPGSPTVTGALPSYGGGDVVEEVSICVVLTDADATLDSATATAFANGANLCAISRGVGGSPCLSTFWELLQFRDAVLVAPKTYVLTGFLRGRKGTLTTGHSIGDTFVLLPVTNVDAPEAELNRCYKYKAVTFGTNINDAPVQDFVNTGEATDAFYDTENDHLPVFIGDSGTGGVKGLVPAPAAGDCAAGKYLDACGGWSVPPSSGGSGSPGGGGGGSMVQAQYLVMTSDPGLTQERVATASSNISIHESGSPGSIATWDLTTTGVLAGVYGATFSIPVITVDAYGRITTITTASTVGRIHTLDEGTSVDANAIALNFRGPLLHAVDAGAGVTEVISADIHGVGVTVVAGSPNALTITGAPIDAQYVVRALNSSLTNETLLRCDFTVACSDEVTAISAQTAVVTFRMPFAMTVTEVRSSLTVASTSGLPTVDINESGSTILSTKLTIDANELTSTTAATPAVISDSSLADDAEITIDIDTAGTGAKGLKVTFLGTYA